MTRQQKSARQTVSLQVHPGLVEELNQIAQLLEVPLVRCANEAIARWLQNDAVMYVRKLTRTSQDEIPAGVEVTTKVINWPGVR